MADTYINYKADGSTNNFKIPFEYLKQTYVNVYVDNVLQKGGSYGDTSAQYFFLDKSTICFYTAPTVASTVKIQRVTSASERVVSFKDASVLRADNLNTSQIQTVHIAAEARDSIDNAITINTDGNWNAKSTRIINVASPIDLHDAVNYITLTQIKNNVSTLVNEAVSYKDLAKKFAVNPALTYFYDDDGNKQYSALSYATEAKNVYSQTVQLYNKLELEFSSIISSAENKLEAKTDELIVTLKGKEAELEVSLEDKEADCEAYLENYKLTCISSMSGFRDKYSVEIKELSENSLVDIKTITDEGLAKLSDGKAEIATSLSNISTEVGRATSEADRAKSEADRAKQYANNMETGTAQSDWSETDITSHAYIINKPTKLSDFENDLNISDIDLSNVPELTFTGGTTLKSTGGSLTVNDRKVLLEGDVDTSGGDVDISNVSIKDLNGYCELSTGLDITNPIYSFYSSKNDTTCFSVGFGTATHNILFTSSAGVNNSPYHSCGFTCNGVNINFYNVYGSSIRLSNNVTDNDGNKLVTQSLLSSNINGYNLCAGVSTSNYVRMFTEYGKVAINNGDYSTSGYNAGFNLQKDSTMSMVRLCTTTSGDTVFNVRTNCKYLDFDIIPTVKLQETFVTSGSLASNNKVVPFKIYMFEDVTGNSVNQITLDDTTYEYKYTSWSPTDIYCSQYNIVFAKPGADKSGYLSTSAFSNTMVLDTTALAGSVPVTLSFDSTYWTLVNDVDLTNGKFIIIYSWFATFGIIEILEVKSE